MPFKVIPRTLKITKLDDHMVLTTYPVNQRLVVGSASPAAVNIQ